MEVIYATYRTNKFINRGFLNGPVCPIYGTGVVIGHSELKFMKEIAKLIEFSEMKCSF